MALPGGARSNPVDVLVVDVWTSFAETCIPFLQNPRNALEAPIIGHPNVYEIATPDQRITWRNLHDPTNQKQKVHEIGTYFGRDSVLVQCEVGLSEIASNQFNTVQISEALQRVIGNSDGLTLHGGRALPTKNNTRADAQELLRSENYALHLIEGALKPLPDFVEVEISEGYFGFFISVLLPHEGG